MKLQIFQNRSQAFALLLASLYIAGVHSSASLDLGIGPPIPFALCAMTAIITVMLVPVKIRWGSPLVVFVIMALLVNVLSFNGLYADKYVLGLLQLLYSIWIGFCAYAVAISIPSARWSNYCLNLVIAITGLSVLEMNSFISEVFGTISAFLVSGNEMGYSEIAHQELRDVVLHGGLRSKALAIEPSHAAITLLALSYAMFWTPKINLVRFLIWLFLMLACMITIRSPIVAIAVVTTSAFYALSVNARLAIVYGPAVFLILLLLVVIFDTLLKEIFLARWIAIEEGEGSFIMRFVAPFEFVRQKSSEYVLLGVGVVGNLDMLSAEIESLYRSIGVSFISSETAGNSLTNNLAVHFIYFGICGGLVAIWLLIASVRLQSKILWSALVVQLLVVWMSAGGYVSARMWVYSSLLVAAARRSEWERRTAVGTDLAP